MTDGVLTHHQRGHWSLCWECPTRHVWRVEHFKSKAAGRQFADLMDINIIKETKGHKYVQIGSYHGN